ncbi:hypothetical protein ACHAPF_009711 [Botrytis cinerea]
MHGTDILALAFRIGQFAFSTIVVGLTSSHLHSARTEPSWSKKRFIYTDVVAALGLFVSLFFMLPFTWNFIHWPIDFLMFVMYMIAFGLLVDGTYIHYRNRHTVVTDQPANNGQQSNGLGGARKKWYRSRAEPSRI